MQRELELGVLENLILSRNLSEQIQPERPPGGQRLDLLVLRQSLRPDHRLLRQSTRAWISPAAPAHEVVAVAAGVVTWSRERFGYGKMVEINHGNGFVTRYAHNERNLVSVGDTVQKGQPIALWDPRDAPPARTCISKCCATAARSTRCSSSSRRAPDNSSHGLSAGPARTP